MARRRFLERAFPPEREEELLKLIEDYGDFADLGYLASYFETTKTAVHGFLRTKKAKAAKDRYLSGHKEAMERYAHSSPVSYDPAFPDSDNIEKDLKKQGGFSFHKPTLEGSILGIPDLSEEDSTDPIEYVNGRKKKLYSDY